MITTGIQHTDNRSKPMAQSPAYKIYTHTGEYIASCKHPGDAAALIAGTCQPGATIRHGHRVADIVWTEGEDGTAAESFDQVAETCMARVEERWRAATVRNGYDPDSFRPNASQAGRK